MKQVGVQDLFEANSADCDQVNSRSRDLLEKQITVQVMSFTQENSADLHRVGRVLQHSRHI
jgi:hypothetical protein